MPIVFPLDNLAALREQIMQRMQIEVLSARTGEWHRTACPEIIVQTLLARRGGAAPPLTGIVEAPTIRGTGALLTQQGYDSETGLFLMTGGTWAPIPDHPGRDDALGGLVSPFSHQYQALVSSDLPSSWLLDSDNS